MNIEDRRFNSLKVLLLLAVFTIVSVTFCFKILAPSLAQDGEKREIEDQIPKHLPLKVKLKKEKEEKVKDFRNDAWVLDFELEVTNTSEKPIYFLNMYVLLPEFVVPNGGIKGMPLRYGRIDFVKSATRPLPDDVPIQPGETYIFKILDQDQRAWSVRKAAGLAPNPRKLRLIFSDLSFGDGTGFSGTTGLPYPNKQISKADLDARCLEQRAQKQEWRGDVRIGPPELLIRQPLFETRPAAILPVRFFESTSVPVRPPQSGLCCPGTQCSFLKPSTYFCSCGVAVSVDTASCSDPEGQCATAQYVDRDCEGLGVKCPEYVRNTDCNTGGPTPTPTPTPVPCPETSPGNCSSGIPIDYCTYDYPPGIDPGCPPFYHTDQGGCCVRDECPLPTPTPPDCCNGHGFLSFSPPPICSWSCLPPLPSECNEGSGFPSDYCAYPSGCPSPYYDAGGCCQYSITPILIDVDGSGFHLTNANHGVWFDFPGRGIKRKISWTQATSTNSWLVLDRNGNGTIDNGAELFGNFSPQPHSAEPHGFIALAEYDKRANGGNRDGVINRQDSIFVSLRLWRDANHNGFSEAAELSTLPQVGLKTLDLDYKTSRQTDPYGNQFRYRAKVKDTHDAQLGRWAWDVFLVRSP
jgi:hypothetical protein